MMLLSSCSGGSSDDAQTNQTIDSLTNVINQQDTLLNDIFQAMNDIEESMKSMSEAEGRVTIAQRGEGASQKARILEDIAFIQEQQQRNRELIEQLQDKLRSSTFKSEQLQKAINNLQAQIEEKDQSILKLTGELDIRNQHIAKLDKNIDQLHDNVDSLQVVSAEKTSVIESQDRALHKAWFVFGTKSELKQKKILDGGKVLQGDFDRNYFTEIDIRNEKQIKLYTKSASLLTSHPANSYKLERDAEKRLTLIITNPQTFWSTSRYLVIQVK